MHHDIAVSLQKHQLDTQERVRVLLPTHRVVVLGVGVLLCVEGFLPLSYGLSILLGGT